MTEPAGAVLPDVPGTVPPDVLPDVLPGVPGAVVAGDVDDEPECLVGEVAPLGPPGVDGTDCFAVGAAEEQPAVNSTGAARAEAAVAALRRKLRREAD